MTLHDLSASLKKHRPTVAFRAIRSVGTATLTPIQFSWSSGHFRSSLLNRAVSRDGKPTPWYTYPAISFLSAKSYAGRRVLEWGAGQSTLWWASRAESVFAVESDLSWYRHLQPLVPSNVTLKFADVDVGDIARDLTVSYFDLVVVDGLDRLKCAMESIRLLSDNGAIILDNSEGYWGRDGEYPILDVFRASDFSRIDFYGHAPGVIKPHCTSIFFKGPCFLFAGTENVQR